MVPIAGHIQHFASRLDVRLSAIKLMLRLRLLQRPWRKSAIIFGAAVL